MPVLGFPDGSLSGHTEALLKNAGVELPVGFLEERKYLFPLSPNEFHPFDELQILRPQDMPLAIHMRMVDVGFSGQDWFFESGLGEYLKVIATLNYSKALLKPPKIVVLGRQGYDFHDTEKTVVATEYPTLARERFKNAKIITLKGKTESWVVGGAADFCVDLFDQGTTARINNLVVIGEPIISSPTILLAREDSVLLSGIDVFVQKLKTAFFKLVT